MNTIFRYDLATWNGPRIILITDTVGKHSPVPLLGTVVLPSACANHIWLWPRAVKG